MTGAQSRSTSDVPQVLFVDDEPALLEGLRVALRKEAFHFLSAGSGAAGLEILAQQQVDVVVSDERMPGMVGSEFLRLVRERYPSTVRIMLTGQASLEATIKAINEGEVFRFLVKPCSPVQLAHTISDALLIRGLSREGARLLQANREQRKHLEQLDRAHPGISHVARTLSGAIMVDAPEDDPYELLRLMRRELEETSLPHAP